MQISGRQDRVITFHPLPKWPGSQFKMGLQIDDICPKEMMILTNTYFILTMCQALFWMFYMYSFSSHNNPKSKILLSPFFRMNIVRQRETELVIQGHNGVSGWTITWTVCSCFYFRVKRIGLYCTVGKKTPLQLAQWASLSLLRAAREAVFLQDCLQSQGGFMFKRLGVREAQLLGSHICSSLLMSCSLGKY